MTSRPSDDLLREFLASNDASCPVCEYELRGAPEPVCPECAAPLRLGVISHQARPGPWLVALGSWTLALGFDGVVALMFSVGIIVARPPLSAGFPYILAGTFLALSAGAAVGLHRVLRSRAKWNAKPNRAQWRDAVLTFIIVASLHLAVGGTLILAG